MCGIFGIMQHRATLAPSRELLQDTARRLHHRGPDGCGIHAEAGIGLVNTRLSLVDLNERSNQPFWDSTGRYCLVYNGELYDYADLKTRLERCGVVFRTTSDTEVLLVALIHLGIESALAQLEGMFAFALYDAREKALVLARDRFGIKPLYLHHSDDAFVFASSVSAMRPWLPLRPDPLTVSSYLQGSNGPMAGRSFYQQVEIVPPGAIIRVQLGGRAQFSQLLRVNDLADPDQAEALVRTPRDTLVDRVEQLLLKSVESQLCADAPVGAFCSGGVDSSLLVAMAARSHANLKVFHADVVGPLSEREAATRLARHLKLDLQSIAVRDHHFLDLMPDVVEHFEFPFFVHPTAIPLFLVSQLARQHDVKAVLCGEGSDECYLGYPWLAPNILDALRHLPRGVYRRLSRRLRGWTRPIGDAEPAGTGSSLRDRELVRGLPNQFELELGPAAYGELEDPSGGNSRSKLSLASAGELFYILRTLLHRNDTMGMAASIEARFPFLDSRLVKLAVNLPYGCKVRFSPFGFDPAHLFFRDKWIVRKVAQRYLPAALSQRRKRMFPTDSSQRLRISERFFEGSFVSDWFGLSRPRLRYLLDSASPELKRRLFHLDAWGHVCVRGSAKADLARRLREHVQVSPSA